MIGQDIRALRTRYHLTRAQLAELVGRTDRQVLTYETSVEALPLFVELAFEAAATRLEHREKFAA